MLSGTLLVGLDVGSTTVKVAVVDPETRTLLHSAYVRHNADQRTCAAELLEDVHARFADATLRLALCGSGAIELARDLGAFFTQEVVANGLAVARLHPETRTAIELGGQDAKILFFHHDVTGEPVVSDMRMNGVCAGGTGAFVDQIASLLRVPTEEIGGLAAQGQHVFDVSGRCGVFAKTDIQPLLNQGVPRSDIALSAFHAIARQVIGGLAQGATIEAPVLLEGGPLAFNPVLARVFRERLGVDEGSAVVPAHAETLVAYGAALSAALLHEGPCGYSPARLTELRRALSRRHALPVDRSPDAFFASAEERAAFESRHRTPPFTPALALLPQADPPQRLPVYLGIDAGSTTSKFVLLREDGTLVDSFYQSNEGDPVATVRAGLLELRRRYLQRGWELHLLGAGSTGYGERLLSTALRLDFHTVETLAHTRAAVREHEDVSFILDIGGQDMKAIFVRGGIPVNFVLNEACSAGCGSFLETFASAMSVRVQDVADLAFEAASPSRLGSRCTVFMNSSVITEQKNGKSVPDIMAGLCRSVVENALTKVLRISNPEALGPRVVVQGGTFRNDAVLRAFETRIGRQVHRPAHPGEMGAIGVALLTIEHLRQHPGPSRFTWDRVEQLQSTPRPTTQCRFCQNHCTRTVVEFPPDARHVAGNRCEKGEILDDDREVVKLRLKEVTQRLNAIPDLVTLRERELTRRYDVSPVRPNTGQRIGIPRSLEFWDSLPFWSTFFRALGFEVVLSPRTDGKLLEKGSSSVASDTICLPAKVVHGHVLELIERKVDRIFNPLVLKTLPDGAAGRASWMCPVVQGYAEVVRIHDQPQERHGIAYDAPAFQWDTQVARDRQLVRFARETFGVRERQVRAAIVQADTAQRTFRNTLRNEGQRVLDALRPGQFAVVLAGRPYHADAYINHGLPAHFVGLGIPVFDLDSLPGVEDVDLSSLLVETNNTFHTRLLAAAVLAARRPDLELVQMVSFGCGHDAILSDELVQVMERESGRTPLVLKLDEGESRGPIGIRVRSFVEAVRTARQRRAAEVA